MNTQPDKNNCPKCGEAISKDAPHGLCPKCVLMGAEMTLPGTNPRMMAKHPEIKDLQDHFPDLEIIEMIGAGGMGAVYKARQRILDRMVALKILATDLSDDPSFSQRFQREARLLASLKHQNIVSVHEFGTSGPFHFLTMEYIDGVNLRQAMDAGGFSPAESLKVVSNICGALKFAHSKGVLHRDIKPANILLDAEGEVKIADFGIAKLVGMDDGHDMTLTLTGAVMGTPQYMAPEQLETPDDVDHRADIYSLGVVFYELLTGELPLGRFSLPSEKSALDVRIDHIVMRTLEKEREARYQSASDMQTEMDHITESGHRPVHVVEPSYRSEPAADDSGSARYSLLAPILTGCSLLGVAAMTAPLLNYLHEKSNESASILLILMILIVVLFGIAGVVGGSLGAACLGDVRRSNGEKRGYGSGIFAITAWPHLILFSLCGVLPFLMLPSLNSSPYKAVPYWSLLLLVPVILGGASGTYLHQLVSRWGKNKPNPLWKKACLVIGFPVALLSAFIAPDSIPYGLVDRDPELSAIQDWDQAKEFISGSFSGGEGGYHSVSVNGNVVLQQSSSQYQLTIAPETPLKIDLLSTGLQSGGFEEFMVFDFPDFPAYPEKCLINATVVLESKTTKNEEAVTEVSLSLTSPDTGQTSHTATSYIHGRWTLSDDKTLYHISQSEEPRILLASRAATSQLPSAQLYMIITATEAVSTE